MTWTRDKVRNPNHGTTQATNLDMNLNMNIEQANNQGIKEKEKKKKRKKKTRHCTYPSGSIPGLEAGLPFLSTLSPPEVVDCRAD